MTICVRSVLLGFLICSVLVGCSSSYKRVKPTVLTQSQVEVPEEQLLDVGISLSGQQALSESKLKKFGTGEDIRRSESVYVPFQLKRTMQRSGFWGPVSVLPPEEENVDLRVGSTLGKSNGEALQLTVVAKDATGKVWFKRKYDARATKSTYNSTVPQEEDAFQDLYNTVANDLSGFLGALTPEEIDEIRTVSKLKFAGEIAQDPFASYLSEDRRGRVTIERVPADDDPLMDRIGALRERQFMFVDTLNVYYEGFHAQMWDAYENWRKYNLAEQVARREMERKAFLEILLGALMIAGAVALEVADVENTSTASTVLILAGGQVVINGINVSQQAEIHAAALDELRESFGSEMRPTVLELEGKQYELTGTADEQYARWKDILRRMYLEETGFLPDDLAEGDASTSESGVLGGQ